MLAISTGKRPDHARRHRRALRVWIVAVSAWHFTDTWVLLGLAGIAVKIATGAGFLGPESERLGKLGAERDPSDPEIQRRI